ncbi:MAG TPA: protoheme IX farnesyltransferase [Pseudoclavibacter sp.]|nr:protoheme IX farnesyltransferase [Pseudoclavibacter sp.]
MAIDAVGDVIRSTSPRGSVIGRKARAYLALSKPRIIELLLVATVPTMVVAAGGWPPLWLVVTTVVGGFCSAAGANAFNCYHDRDIDRVMLRTKDRPLVTGELSAREALVFAWVMSVGSVVLFGMAINWLAAGLTAFAVFFYAVVYTRWLKRRTVQNIVWGGVAGCMPVLIAWAATTGELSWSALCLFGVIFLWTPPHYWPLALKYRSDYERASVPMLPVLHGQHTVGVQIILYAWATVFCSLLLIVVQPMGLIYAVSSAGIGAWFIAECHRLFAESARGNTRRAMKVFHGSIVYLSVVFIAVAIDPLLYIPVPLLG